MENLLGEFTPLLYVIFLATINTELVDFLKTPIERRFPEADLWWMQYVNLVTGGLIAWFGGANVLAGMDAFSFGDPIFGRILSAFLVGGGSNLIFRIFKQSS